MYYFQDICAESCKARKLYLTRLKRHYNLSPKDDKNQDRPVFCGLLSVLTVLFITPNQRVTFR